VIVGTKCAFVSQLDENYWLDSRSSIPDRGDRDKSL
jgi:hypothetical protein